MKYFKSYPTVNYDGTILRNILLHVGFIREVFNRMDIYYPYTIEDWERPDTIAADYYGSPDYFWVVLMSNDMIDPYNDWYKPEDVFRKWIENKYGQNIYDLMNITHHYEYVGDNPRITHTLTQRSYDLLDLPEKNDWKAISIYDYEKRLNNEKKHIRLLDNEYLPQVRDELRKIFSK